MRANGDSELCISLLRLLRIFEMDLLCAANMGGSLYCFRGMAFGIRCVLHELREDFLAWL